MYSEMLQINLLILILMVKLFQIKEIKEDEPLPEPNRKKKMTIHQLYEESGEEIIFEPPTIRDGGRD